MTEKSVIDDVAK